MLDRFGLNGIIIICFTCCRPQDIDYPVPAEYMINVAIRDKLATMKMKQYKDDLLFFLFYTNVGDVMQIAAANELYVNDALVLCGSLN